MGRKDALHFLGGLVLGTAAVLPARASTINVNTAADAVENDGQCTLREAIIAANDNVASGDSTGECGPGEPLGEGMALDVIEFHIPGQGPFSIHPTKPLPLVTEGVFIDGYSQAGARPNSLRVGSNAVLMIELRGDLVPPGCQPDDPPIGHAAITFYGTPASYSRLRGLAFNSFDDGGAGSGVVMIFRAGGVQVDGNFIGFDAAGRASQNSGASVGVFNGSGWIQTFAYGSPREYFNDGGPGNLIGGSSPQERNVIAGGGGQVIIGGQRNRVEGNYIGVEPQGLAWVGSGSTPILLGELAFRGYCSHDPRIDFDFVATDNTIGSSRGGNFIAPNWYSCAVFLGGMGNRVDGNLIGTDREGDSAGLGPLAQGLCGVELPDFSLLNVISNNVIANTYQGVVVMSGVDPMGNDITANSIYAASFGLGIDLGNDGVTANDYMDLDAGPNGLQNFPEGLVATTMGVSGSVMSQPASTLRIDIYESRDCNSSGNGAGERFLGSASVRTDGGGNATFDQYFPGGLQLDHFVTATATAAVRGTSEFSACARVTQGSGVSVEVGSSANPARSLGESFVLTVRVRTPGGRTPTGVVSLYDLDSPATTPPYPYHLFGSGYLHPSATPGVAEMSIDSTQLTHWSGSAWGRLRILAHYRGDAFYAPATAMEFDQVIYRPKADLDGDGSTDLVLCDGASEKYLVRSVGGSLVGPTPLGRLSGRTVLGIGVFSLPETPAVVWRDVSGALGGTIFSHGTLLSDFSIPLPAGLSFEGLGSMSGYTYDDFIAREDTTGFHFGVRTQRLGGGRLGLSPPSPVAGVPNDPIEAIGDFNGDGKLDWHTRNLAPLAYWLWFLDGDFNLIPRSTPLDGVLAQAGDQVVATGDFNGDGRTDLVWSLPSGDFKLVMQDGTTTLDQVNLSSLGGTGLQLVGTGFFDDGSGNSGGRSSLVVRNPMSGLLAAWINTGVNGYRPVFGTHVTLPNTTGLSMCVP